MKSYDLDNNPINLDNALYTAEEMATVVEYKKQKRLSRKPDLPEFTCFVFKNNELTDFITLLNKNKKSLPDKTRFQFVYEFDGHWISGDIRTNQGKLEFFIFDSLNSIVNLKPVISMIKRNASRAIITYVSGDKLQTVDFKNCGSFALDHAANMAKINDLHEHVDQLKKTPDETSAIASFFAKFVRNNTLMTLPTRDFPIEFGPLLRNMQSVSTLESIFFGKGYKGSAKHTLEEHLEKNSKEIEIDGHKKIINNSIENKREKLKTKASIFFKEIDTKEKAEKLKNYKARNAEIFAGLHENNVKNKK